MMQSKNQIKSREILVDDMTDCVDRVSCKCKFETGKIKPLKTPTSSDEKGATMLEYGVMVALIVVGSVAAITSLGETIKEDGFVKVQAGLAQSCFPGNCN